MQVLEDAIIINVSPAQKEIIRNPRYSLYIHGMQIDRDDWNRPRIPIVEVKNLVARLERLKAEIVKDPAYAKRNPQAVVDRIIVRIQDAAAAQARTYG